MTSTSDVITVGHSWSVLELEAVEKNVEHTMKELIEPVLVKSA